MQTREAARGHSRIDLQNAAQAHEALKWRCEWLIRRYESEAAYRARRAYNESEIHGNLLLNGGIQSILDNLCATGSPTQYSNANSSIGIGDGGPSGLTGTVTYSNGSATVTGSGTAFTTELAVGDYLIGGDGLIYTVSAIGSNTSLTISAVYAGITVAGWTAYKVLREIATQTGLQASSNKKYNAMEATFPSRASQTTTFKSVFASGDANYAWREFAINNANDGSGTNLNRKVSYQGVKASGQVWTASATVTLS